MPVEEVARSAIRGPAAPAADAAGSPRASTRTAAAGGRGVWCLAAVIVLALAGQTVPAVAQQSSDGDSPSKIADGEGNAGSQKGTDDGDPSFLDSILPDFVKGWFGMDDGPDASGSGQADGSGGSQSGQDGRSGGGQQTPVVVAARAELQSVGERYEFIGRIEAIQKVTVQARVAGFIQEVFFKGGDEIKAGDKLFKIEPDQYEVQLQAAKAQLASTRATEAQTQRALQRNQELAQNGTVAQAQLDDARATYQQAQGTRMQAEAQVRQAELALNYTTIVAPIDGQISEPLITKGNYVTVSSGALANLIQEDPIWGTFPIGENRLSTWRRVGIDGRTRSDDADTAAGYDLSLILPNEQEYGQSGAFSFVSNTVDPQTGTVMVRVEFPNENGILLPDENVTLVASQKDPPRQPVVPQAAVQLGREGRSVFVLTDDDIVHRRPITVGKTLQGEVAVTKGLKGGEYVVVQGLQNIGDGTRVKPNFQNGKGPTPGGKKGGDGAADGDRQTRKGAADGDQPPAGSKEGADSAFGTSTGRSRTPAPDAEANGGGGGGGDRNAAAPSARNGSGPGGSGGAGQDMEQAKGAGQASGRGAGAGKQPDNSADQRIGTQAQSETRAASEAGPANKQTPVDPQAQGEPRTKSENTGGKPASRTSGNGA